MQFLDQITKETLIICNKYVKDKILKQNKLLNIKIFTMQEFISKYCFDYDENTILYVMNKYSIKYEIAKIYIDNLYFVNNEIYNVKKLDELVDLKKELDINNLLIYCPSFQEYVKNIDIIIYDMELNNFEKNMFKNLKYQIIQPKQNNYEHKILYFNTMEEEVEYIAKQICILIENGIKPDEIKLTNVDSSYYNPLTRIFNLFGLKVNIPYTSLLSSYKYIQEFIKNYRETDLDKSLENINRNDILYEELISIINKYVKYNNKELMIYKIEQSTINSNKYTNAIDIVDFLEYPSDDNEHIFMLGFNDGIIPKSYKDTDFLTDNIKQYINLETTKEKNILLRKEIMSTIHNIKNLTITYKLKDTKKTYYPSSLCNNFDIEQGQIDNLNSYSDTYNKIKLVKSIDEYIKYGSKNKDFELLNNNYKIKYNSYNNKYSLIENKFETIKLSYSKMQTYNKCAFRYYLSNVLKIDIYTDSYQALIGRVIHYVMEKCLTNNNEEIELYINEYIKDINLTKKESFFLEKYKQGIKDLLAQIKLEKEYSSLDSAMYEKEIQIDLGNNVTFTGIIDKILYKEDNNNTYLALIDYKTGAEDINLNYLNYGLNIQLPIYLYLSENLDLPNKTYCGFYLQKFNIANPDYRLIGYSNSNKDVLSVIDNNYENSKIIKSMKTLKDGSFSSHAKILSNDEINEIKDITKVQIQQVISNIQNNIFDINPKIDNGKNISCEYCKFKDICFVKKYNQIKIYPEEFVGDKNGLD